MELEYVGRAQGELVLSLDKRQETLILRNATRPSTTTLFKVQCTAPHKLRVRPALGFLASGDEISIQIQLNPQECSSATCKLLVVGRQASSTIEQLKTMWRAAEADADTLVLSETVNVRIIDESDAASIDTNPHIVSTSINSPQLTTAQIADLVLLLMKSQSHRKENELTTDEQEQLKTAKALYQSEWPCWEEYAARMRKLLRERSKRKALNTA
ncbi:MSP domain-containing hypothetical protein [Phytophthora megakarya]|uniref:MSP domain-containing protein n=1 Tax=Phytophthora megakarya TaxID=4795 RepID=A0A225V418_9STRA|nr:MSP domain-containing hypothetical protein [Phytophthora megakarya]